MIRVHTGSDDTITVKKSERVNGVTLVQVNGDREIPVSQFYLTQLIDALLAESGLVFKRPVPRVDVLHDRDPDSACEVRVYLDGTLAEHHEHSIDPGAGYESDYWQRRIEEVRADTEMPAEIQAYLLERYEDLKTSKWNLT